MKISLVITPFGSPIYSTPEAVTTLAHSGGADSNEGVVGFTVPSIEPKLPDNHVEWKPDRSEFRLFSTAVLELHMRQEVHLSNALLPCARAIWLDHELEHVRDNDRAFARMDRALRADDEFASLLEVLEVWQPADQLQITRSELRAAVHAVFLRVTVRAANRRDTPAEYASVARQIRLRCGQSISPVLRQGTIGHGVDQLQILLNHLPRRLGTNPLKVDGIFGPRTANRVREFQAAQGLASSGVVETGTWRALGL